MREHIFGTVRARTVPTVTKYTHTQKKKKKNSCDRVLHDPNSAFFIYPLGFSDFVTCGELLIRPRPRSTLVSTTAAFRDEEPYIVPRTGTVVPRGYLVLSCTCVQARSSRATPSGNARSYTALLVEVSLEI
jgi:hypothetical protein